MHVKLFARVFLMLTWLSLIMMIASGFSPSQNINAQIFGNRTQEWVDSENNVKIKFATAQPFVANDTRLNFSVDDLKSGKNLKNLTANISVINNLSPSVDDTKKIHDKDFITFNNITVPSGTFSIKYKFLQEGVHEVIIKVESKNNFSTLASFYIVVLASLRIHY